MSERGSRAKTKRMKEEKTDADGKKVLTTVLDKIIWHIPDVAQVMKLRMVNKMFNENCLKVLRTSHFQKIFMEFFRAVAGEHFIRINDIDLMISEDEAKDQFLPFMRVLRERVDVNPTKLELENFYLLDRKFHATIHDAVFQQLIPVDKRHLLTHVTGLEDICQEGCEQCTSLVRQCQVFGPLQRHALQNAFDEPTVFRELIITDRLLIDIALQSLNSSNNHEQLLENVNQLIRPITCAHLVICFPELRLNSIIPREVLDIVLVAWEPRTIGLEFHEREESRLMPDRRSLYNAGNFTKSDIIGERRLTKNEAVTFESVKVDFTHTNEYKDYYIVRGIMENIKNMFPTNHMIFSLKRHLWSCHYLEALSVDLVRVILTDNFLRLDVDVLPQMLHHQRELRLPSSIEYEDYKDQVFNLTIENNHEQDRLKEERFPFRVVEYTGSRYVYKSLNRELRINVWLEKKKFLKEFHESDDYEFPKGRLAFVKNFLDPKHVEECRKCRRMIREDKEEDSERQMNHIFVPKLEVVDDILNIDLVNGDEA